MKQTRAPKNTTVPSASSKAKVKPKGKQTRRKASGKGKRAREDSDGEEEPSKRVKVDDAPEQPHTFTQPSLITGATLKDYQLEGVEWMIGLDKNGVSGILGVYNISDTRITTSQRVR